MIAGVILAVMGGLIWLFARFSGLNDLPGTLRFNLGGVTCLVPILASIVLSIVLTLVFNLIVRLLNR